MSVQLALSVVVFVAVLVSLSALSWGMTARQEARRRQIAHRLGLEQSPRVALRMDRASEAWQLRSLRDLIGRAGMHEEVRHLLVRMFAAALGGVVITAILFRGPVAVLGLVLGLVPLLLMERRARKRSRQLGLTIPILLVLSMGVLEWGRLMIGEVALVQVASDAALAGARTEVVDNPDAAARSRATEGLAAAGYPYENAEIDIGRVTLGTGEALSVTVRVPHDPWVPFVPSPSTLSAESVARGGLGHAPPGGKGDPRGAVRPADRLRPGADHPARHRHDRVVRLSVRGSGELTVAPGERLRKIGRAHV